MKRFAPFIVLLTLATSCSGPEQASTGAVPTPADIKAGRAVATAACARCHGLNGKGTGPEIPNLAAQNASYLLFTLRAYKAKTRGSEPMQSVVASLTGADVVNVAGYYASLKPITTGAAPAVIAPKPATVPSQAAAVAAGKAATAACAGCHGMDGKSLVPGTPDLAGQNPQYLASAIRAYMEGSRKHPVMQGAVAKLSKADVENLAIFYSEQEPKARKKTLTLAEWVERCNRCHEPGVENPVVAFPKIRGQPAGYIAKELKAYKEESSRTNSMMHAMAADLSEAQIQEIAAYYSRQPAK